MPKGETEARGGADMMGWRGEPLALALTGRTPGILEVLAEVMLVHVMRLQRRWSWRMAGQEVRVGTRGGRGDREKELWDLVVVSKKSVRALARMHVVEQ
jgi:hypothetical protein